VTVSWPDTVDEVLAGDMTAALSYSTPAKGAVPSAVAPIGMRDRDAGTVTFTTSLGFGKKLERIEADPRISLAYHARDHGRCERPEYVLVEGRAEPVPDPPQARRAEVQRRAADFLGEQKKGFFWDRWMREYYMVRIPVDVQIERIVVWPDLACAGEPEVLGEALPGDPAPQSPPKKGTGPRIEVDKAAERIRELAHLVLSYVRGDGYPAVVPVELGATGDAGFRLSAARADLIPPGGRRAGLLAHSYRPQLVGLVSQVYTGWLESDGDGSAVYSPHTEGGFKAPPNKTLLALANGYLAKRGYKKARREGKVAA
jgi:Pyridoxamine 5'-phosphate oxidase